MIPQISVKNPKAFPFGEGGSPQVRRMRSIPDNASDEPVDLIRP